MATKRRSPSTGSGRTDDGPKMPIKTVAVELGDEGYPGFEVDVRINASPRLLKQYLELNKDSTDEEGWEAFARIFPGWRIWDEEGKAIPYGPGSLELISHDLQGAMQRQFVVALRGAVMPGPLGSGSSKTESPPPTASPENESEAGSGPATSSGQ